eukprot:9480603-Pyramimonas_sp.AAC.1
MSELGSKTRISWCPHVWLCPAEKNRQRRTCRHGWARLDQLRPHQGSVLKLRSCSSCLDVWRQAYIT